MLTEDQLDNMWVEEDLIDRNDGVSFNDDGNHFINSKKAKRKHSKTNLPEQANINYQEAIKILTCGVCGKLTENFYPMMKKHYENNHYVLEEKTYYCPHQSCGKKIASTNSFHSHIHIVHRAATFQCNQCAKKFKTSGSLAHHRVRWHTNDRPLVCQHCGEGKVDRFRLS